MITKLLKTEDEANVYKYGRKKYKYSFAEIAKRISNNKEEESLRNNEGEDD